jgi:hypothetical protein
MICSRINTEEHGLQKTIKEGHGKSFEKEKMRIDLKPHRNKYHYIMEFRMEDLFLTLRRGTR